MSPLARSPLGLLGGRYGCSPDSSRRELLQFFSVRRNVAATAGMRLVPGHARLRMFDHDKMDRTDTDVCTISSWGNCVDIHRDRT